MSMRELGGLPALTADQGESDDLLDEEIRRQLSQIGDEELAGGDADDAAEENDISLDHGTEDGKLQVDVIPSMEQYVSWIQDQTRNLEQELEECDDLLHQSEIATSRKPHSTEDELLVELAQKEGVDVETFKNKILDEISKQDEADQKHMQNLSNEPDIDQNQNEQFSDHEAFGTELPEKDTQPSAVRDDITQLEDQSNPSRNDTVSIHGQSDNSNAEGKSVTFEPGQGVIAEITEADLLEKQFWKQMKELEDRRREREEEQQKETEAQKLVEDRQREESNLKRKQKQAEYRDEETELRRKQEEDNAKLKLEADRLQEEIETSLHIYENEIKELSAQTNIEKQEFEETRKLEADRLSQRRHDAVITLQAGYRGYRVRKEHGNELHSRLEIAKEQKVEMRVQQIEEERRQATEAKKKVEEEELEKIQRQKEEDEERKQKQEEERKQREAEQQRLKEEKERRKQEEKQRKEEEKQRKEQEKQRKEQEKQRKEEEKRKLEEEKKRKAEEDKRLEKEKIEKAEEQKRQEEAELERKLEEQRKEDERQKKEQEKQTNEDDKLEEEILQKKMSDVPSKKPAADPVPTVEATPPLEPQKPSTPLSQKPAVSMVPTPPQGSDSRPQSARRSRQGLVGLRSSRAFLTGLRPPPTWGENLPADIDRKRLDWIRDCIAWSKVLGEVRTQRPAVSKKPPRRPVSGKKLPLLGTVQVLDASGASALQQVTTVELRDLPGCSIKTLSQCAQLRSITMNNCHLVATEGLEHCRLLEYADFQQNQIEIVNFKDLSHLVYLDLSNNSLTSIHGFDGCLKLKYVNLGHNKITRIGGLDHLQSLHTLVLSHNQLTSTRGLSAAPTVQNLDLSHNYLASLDDLDKLGLLQTLVVHGNNLRKIPKLTNHVLLRKLVLNENNHIDGLEGVHDSWLPMLQTLHVEQNSLTSFAELKYCILLEDLNIGNNQILDLESVIPGLVSVRHLTSLTADGNPVTEEKDWKSVIEDKLPHLCLLDGVTLTSTEGQTSNTKFEAMCLAQIHQHMAVEKAYNEALSKVSTVEEKCIIHNKYFSQSYNIATEHRYVHEYGEVSSQIPTTVNADFFLQKDSSSNQPQSKPEATDMKSKFDAALASKNVHPDSVKARSTAHQQKIVAAMHTESGDWQREIDTSLESKTPRVATAKSRPADNVSDIHRESKVVVADNKAKFDALFKAPSKSEQPSGSRTSDANMKTLNGAGTEIGSNDKTSSDVAGKAIRADAVGKILKEEGMMKNRSGGPLAHAAAVRIQATWRGFSLRKRLSYALMYARMEEEEQADNTDFGEVDLNDFNFNEEDLEKDWIPSEYPQLPENHVVLRNPDIPENSHPAAAAPRDAVPRHPQDAWRTTVSPPGGQKIFPSGKPPLPPLSRLSNHTAETLTDGGHTHRSRMSKREEKISEDWGFKDQRTAELMMQRAKKLKYNAVKKKKIGKLDPKQRLALFRKLEETSKGKPVQPLIRRGVDRKDYFQAREEETFRQHHERATEIKDKQARTFEWLHSQVGNHPVTSSRIQNREVDPLPQAQVSRKPLHHNSEGNLPKMDPTVLAGRRALLTGSPVSIDLQSVESTSVTGDVPKPRRLSMTESAAERLPPIKTSSAPSSHPKEKMSWRNPEVNKSVGWGGGKKRSTVRH